MRLVYAEALGASAAVIAYSEHEADELRRWLQGRRYAVPVEFVPFGVDVEAFAPAPREPEYDVVSIGADPHRDFELLLDVARELPDVSFAVVATGERGRTLPARPANVTLETDLSFADMRMRLEGARVVALPVRENTYSGATTVLLQAMAMAKPVVVTRTQAIARGYGLADGENCRLVPPGDAATFARTLRAVLRDPWHARALGATARRTVERDFTWRHYVDRLAAILSAAAGERPGGRSRRG
jgi:glycosyltransferase involved in cell wall biosynthesis